MTFKNAIQFIVFVRNFTEFIEHRNLLPIYVCCQQLVTHFCYFNSSISVILIYHFYKYLHVAKSLSSQDFKKLVTCHLTATARAYWGYVLLVTSTVQTLSGIDCIKLFLCDIIICNLSLFYFKLMSLELIEYTLNTYTCTHYALEHVCL